MKNFLRKGNKIHFTSLGCARNLVDTEIMLGIVLKAGYEATSQIEEADYLVINTCGFLASARQESCDTIEEILSGKKNSAKVVVTGCMVQNHSSVIKDKFPAVHYLLGSGDVENILKAIEAEDAGESITSARSYLQWGEVPRQIATPRHYAYLKIAEGCAKRCSFCIIPSIKGPLKSKSHEQVTKEFRALLSQQVREVIMIAQDLGDFGKERKEKDGLESLLKEMLQVPGDYWLRLLYLYPDEITPGLIEIMASDARICRYLDMPIQHISDPILKRMRRKTNKEAILNTITQLRAAIPEVVIRTSLMVGFPGETDKQFEEMYEFIHTHPLDNIGIFKFSSEEGAHAATLPDHVAEDVKEARYHRLMQAQLKIVRERNSAYIGKRLQVLLEGYHPDSPYLMRGRFYGQCPEIDGQVIINDAREAKSFGTLHEVEITDCMDYDLIGRIVKPLGERAKAKARLALA